MKTVLHYLGDISQELRRLPPSMVDDLGDTLRRHADAEPGLAVLATSLVQVMNVELHCQADTEAVR